MATRKSKQVDYDRVAANYDRRFAPEIPRGELDALASVVRCLEAPILLEVGCGTGHWLNGLAPLSRRRYGLDASAGMLRQAQSKRVPAGWVQGVAERLPFNDSSIDLVYCVHALHHFTDPQKFIAEAHRLLRPGGILAILGTDPHDGDGSWYIYRYFDGTLQADLERFHKWEQVAAWLAAAGFANRELAVAVRIDSAHTGWDVFSDPFLKKDSTSQLILLSDDAYAQGRQRMEGDLRAAEARGETLTFESRLTIRMLTGYKPSSNDRIATT